ncbi:MAG: zf-TFIIB domain-containing protein [Bacteroidota bacterium]|nr:zf-TFIIB domain-containing protein [Bacteroidota bacterium]MDP3396944.1 zf-TFIIB domain-containing protein [Methanoregula sp.]
MKCPAHGIDLLMGDRLTVHIDYCPKCRGIWFANGKLDKLLKSSTTEPDKTKQNRLSKEDNVGRIGGFLIETFN